MKIGEIEVGEEYGLTQIDGYSNRYSRGLPRQIKAVEIVTVEEKIWKGGNSFNISQGTRNKRLVKVEFLDNPRSAAGKYGGHNLQSFPKGQTTTVDAKYIGGKWSDLHEHVAEHIAREQRIKEAKAAAEARLLKLLGKRKMDAVNSYFNVREFHRHGQKPSMDIDLRIAGVELETILSLAEKGREAS